MKQTRLTWKTFVYRMTPAMLIILAFVGAWALYRTRPVLEVDMRRDTPPAVEVLKLQPGSYPVIISAIGVVAPAKELDLYPQVTGVVRELHHAFEEGGRITTGSVIAQIEPRDFNLQRLERRAEVADAELNLRLEEGAQQIAFAEWRAASEIVDGMDQDLVLRKPHLEKFKAALASAKARLEQAELSLTRTTLTAPFDLLVLSKEIEVGELVSPQRPLGKFVGTETFWVKASVPVDQLPLIRFGDSTGDGSSVVLKLLRQDVTWRGRVLRFLGEIETEGRMANLMIEVTDPLASDRQPLLLGATVSLEIEGRELPEVFAIPRNALRDDAYLWLVNDKGSLDIREVKVIWRTEDVVFVTDGLNAGESLVISTLNAPRSGMRVHVTAIAQEVDQ